MKPNKFYKLAIDLGLSLEEQPHFKQTMARSKNFKAGDFNNTIILRIDAQEIVTFECDKGGLNLIKYKLTIKNLKAIIKQMEKAQ